MLSFSGAEFFDDISDDAWGEGNSSVVCASAVRIPDVVVDLVFQFCVEGSGSPFACP